MRKIAVLLTDLFEDSEYTRPAEAFREAGHKITHIGLKAGSVVKGKKEQTPVTIGISSISNEKEIRSRMYFEYRNLGHTGAPPTNSFSRQPVACNIG
jgi:putative intracellular protease/amidase